MTHRDPDRPFPDENAARGQIEQARGEIAARTEERARLARERADTGGHLAGLQARHQAHGAVELEGRLATVRAEEQEASAALGALRRDREQAQGLWESGAAPWKW